MRERYRSHALKDLSLLSDRWSVSAAASPVSPELALVCPDLRQEWLVALPDIDTEWLFRPARARPRVVPAPAPAPEPEVSFVLAAAVHLAFSILQSLAWGSVAVFIVVAATLILTLAG
jgi:hypothetical protein